MGTLANSEDPDKMRQNVAFYQGTSAQFAMYEGMDGGGGGSGIHYSLKILPIIHLIKILGYSLK